MVLKTVIMANFMLHILIKLKILLFEFLELQYFKTLVLMRAVEMLVVPRKPLEFYDLDFPEATSVRLSTSVNTQSLITHVALLALWLRTSLSLQCHPELNTFCASPKRQAVHCHAGTPWLQKTVSCEESAFHLRPVGYLGTLWHIKYYIWR